jgi:hypothetical protein
MAEACIDIVPDNCEVRDGGTIVVQPGMDDVNV